MVFRISRIQAWALRVPITTPVATSFGVMRNRPGVFLRIEDAEGAAGWGEVFANWPAAGAEHRVNLLMDDIVDLITNRTWSDPPAMTSYLEQTTHIRALQCGEFGPFRQVIAGLDIAAWDLVANRRSMPLAALLSQSALDRVPAYASGIHIDAAEYAIAAAQGSGFNSFKVKVGFDDQTDLIKLSNCASMLRPEESLSADANQAWTVERATSFLSAASDLNLRWMEEPIAADAQDADWTELAALGTPLAAGENIAGFRNFEHVICGGALTFLQPDVCKWGGITGNLHVAQQAREHGLTYCPHYLGGGIGLLASAHLLAAAGGPGSLEVDVNPNPLRDVIADTVSYVDSGHWNLPASTGLGCSFANLPNDLSPYVTLSRERG